MVTDTFCVLTSDIYDRSALRFRFTDCQELHEFHSILLVYVLDGNEDNTVELQVPSREGSSCVPPELKHVFELF